MSKIRIDKAADMPVNSIRQIVIEGCGTIALYRLVDDYCATEDRCSHGDASLSEGDIDGDEIICPFHLGRFDIRSGRRLLRRV
jgi:p-cumate 2,3-dioxygenase ferredoxin component